MANAWNKVCTEVNTCALTGAAAFFAGIFDAAIVANGPLWCYFYALKHLEKTCPSLSKRFYCSQTDNNSVVFGTEEYLLGILSYVKKNTAPKVLLIENSCSVGLIGDDIVGLAQKADMPCPVVCLDSGGLTGGFWEGYRAAAMAYFAAMPLKKRSRIEPNTVNLLGCTTGYYNAVNDIQELKRLLALVGISVLACPGAGSSVDEIATMTQAELNIVVHDELGHDIARYLKKQYGMPYISLLPPYGLEGSLKWLKSLGEVMWLGDGSLQIAQNEANNRKQWLRDATFDMQRIWGDPWFSKTLIAAPSSIALGIAGALRSEWVDTGLLTVAVNNCIEKCPSYEGIDDIIGQYNDGQAVEMQLTTLSGGLLLGSSNEKALLQRQNITDVVCQNIALPVYDEVLLSDQPFMGLRGACYMAERLRNQYIAVCQHKR